MANPFVHVELTTSDPAKAKSVYGALFDWKLDDVEMAPGFTYTMIVVGEGTGGGMMKTPAPGVPTAWLPYVLDRQGEIAWRDGLQGRHGSDGSRLFLDHHGSGRRGDRALATQGEITRIAAPTRLSTMQ